MTINNHGGASDWPSAIADLPPLREVIAASELVATRKLGQNFLLDLNLTDRIARAAASEAGDLSGYDVIEIGPERKADSPESSGNDAARSGAVLPGWIYGASDPRRPAGGALAQ